MKVELVRDGEKYSYKVIDSSPITRVEANKRKQKAKSRNKKQEELPEGFIPIDKEQLLSSLILGYNYLEFKRKTGNIYNNQYKQLVDELIEEGSITKEEISENREKKIKEDKEKVVELLKAGTSKIHIVNNYDIPIYKLEQYIWQMGISDKQIEEWKKEKEDTDRKKGAILKGYEQGLEVSEIIKKFKKAKLDENSIEYYKNILIEEGILTEEKIVEYRKLIEEKKKIKEEEQKAKGERRKRKEDSNDLTETEQKVLYYLEKGYKNREIASITDIDESYISRLKSSIKKKGKITEEQITEAKKKREAENSKEEQEINTIKEEKQEVNSEEEIEQNDTSDLNNEVKDKKKEKRDIDKTKNQLYIRYAHKEETIIDEETKQKIQIKKEQERNLKRIKLEVETYIRLDYETVPKGIKEKIRSYIAACFEFYKDGKIPKGELEILGKAIQKTGMEDKDIIKFSKLCIEAKDFSKALSMLEDKSKAKNRSDENKEAFLKLKNSLESALKIQKAIKMIESNNLDNKTISQVTGLSYDKINIIKIKLSKKPFRLLSIPNREKVISGILKYKNMERLYRSMEMSDFEIEDIENQSKYRKIEEKSRDEVQEIRQDSRVRIIVLLTKYGKPIQTIAKMLKIDEREVEEDLQKGTKAEMIHSSELSGIKLIENDDISFEEILR